LNKLEAGAERKEREARRRNVIIEGINMNEGTDWKREVDRVWAKLEVVGGRKNTRRIGGVDKEGKGMILVEMEGFEKKREVMLAKNKLKREIISLEDDLTFEERRIRRIIIEEAIKERATGNSVKVDYMKMWVNGKLRIWDEAEGRWKLQKGNE
ncbi:GSCOCG00012026001-RA-CDS, partial [Cotesia congregata]